MCELLKTNIPAAMKRKDCIRLNKLSGNSGLKTTDKRCAAALLGILITVTVGHELTDGAALREAQQENKPPVEIMWEAPVSQPRVLEAIKLQVEPSLDREDMPLDHELQVVLQEACQEHKVPIALALGLIEVESGFDPEAVSPKGAYGLCQLNPKYFSADLSPAENIAAGIAYLGELLELHKDTPAALRAYNLGHDDGERQFANAVLAAAERWEE